MRLRLAASGVWAMTLDASSYDRWFTSRWGAYAFAVERDALLSALGPVEGCRLVDVGCGTGRFTAAFAAAGAHVTGIDGDAGMLQVARARTGAGLVQGDAHAIPCPAGAFDLAVAVTLLEFAGRAERVVDELVRVTRPGGRVAVATLNPRSPWGVAHRRALRRPPWSGSCLRTPARLRALLAHRGRLRLHGALYTPGAFPGLPRAGRALERAGRLVPDLGAFQIAVLDLPFEQPAPAG